jgi:hypothetical protein
MNDVVFILVAAVLGLAILVVLPLMFLTLLNYRGSRVVRCPETGERAEVGVDAIATALTSPFGGFSLAVKCCSLWPDRSNCRQGCLRSFDNAVRP